MKKITYLFSVVIALLITTNLNAQDKIFLNSGEFIEAKIVEIAFDEVKYKMFSNQEGSTFSIEKKDIQLLFYENGESQVFKTNNSKPKDISPIEKTKSLIVESINKYGYWENSSNKKYNASFQGDYLMLIVLNSNGEKTNNIVVYDFSNVYKFGQIDKRKKGVTFLNIWVSVLKGGNSNEKEKHKLVLRVMGHDNADSIYQALKKYNSLLIDKKGS